MDKEFVTFEIASKLKELGFDEIPICGYNRSHKLKSKLFNNQFGESGIYWDKYDNDLKAPTWQQAIDWIREEHNIVICVYANASGFLYELHKTIGCSHILDSGLTGNNEGGAWDSYYTARENAILKAIELIK